jgi:hypothetical protein
MEKGFFLGESWDPVGHGTILNWDGRIGLHLRRFSVDTQTLDQFLEEIPRNIRNSIHSGWLKFLESGMVEDFADTSLHGCPTDVRGHNRTIL